MPWCARCGAQAAPGAPRCPDCPSTQFTETEADMPKIDRNGRVSYEADAKPASVPADGLPERTADVKPEPPAAAAQETGDAVPQVPDAAPEPVPAPPPAPHVPPRVPPRRPPRASGGE